MDVREYNRGAWDRQVAHGNPWTIPVGPAEVAAARRGCWTILLTPSKPVPSDWFPPIASCDVLCLASGGGQQGPILAAAGMRVTVLDNSPAQLASDRVVAEREGLSVVTVEGDMADLGVFDDESFDLIVHPVSNTFVPNVRPVWAEAYRVLRRGGLMLAGFTNPAVYLFDDDLAASTGELRVVHALPYSDLGGLDGKELQARLDRGGPLEFSHTLEDQIGGQLDAGFVLTGLYEDGYPPGNDDPLSRFMCLFVATRALKL
ncbi:MAG: class I SAM-dependent methyltransferase [Chloroflexi bacterium]|nr:class I SAM-dependent methyltransferase [Chloroflexota bacterium]